MIVMLGGYMFGRYTSVDQSALSRFAMVVLSPALIFSFLVRNPLPSSKMVQITLSILIFTLLLSVITVFFMKLTGNSRYAVPALLATVFPNSGNYGLPVLLLAYGEEAFSLGVVIVVLHFMLMYSLGVCYASWKENGWRKVAEKMVRLPTT
jgi:predicted permease